MLCYDYYWSSNRCCRVTPESKIVSFKSGKKVPKPAQKCPNGKKKIIKHYSPKCTLKKSIGKIKILGYIGVSTVL